MKPADLRAQIAAHKIELRPLEDLLPYAFNSRKHEDWQVAKIASAIKEFGWTSPVLIDPDGTIIAGHARVMAAHKLDLAYVPCIALAHLSESQRRALVIWDNQSATLSTWDDDMLREEALALQAEAFDLTLLGFDDTELAKILAGEAPPPIEGKTDPDAIPEVKETRCKAADLWTLGRHRLLCGDSTDVLHVERLMGEDKADMVFTDPPYGIAYAGKGITSAGVKGNDFGAIKGDDDISAARDAFNLCKALDVPLMIWWGANFYCSALDDRCSWVIWDKQIVGEFYSACELAWTNQRGRLRMFVHKWHGMVKGSEHGQARVHPTQKPIALAEWCFSEFKAGAKVLDLFLGSGSTLIACEKTGRRCFGMELDPHYCDVILARWEAFTGLKAELEPADGH